MQKKIINLRAFIQKVHLTESLVNQISGSTKYIKIILIDLPMYKEFGHYSWT